MSVIAHRVTVADTLSPLTVQLQQKNASGVLTAVDLTDLVVKFRMISDIGTVVVAETNATIVDADDGKVQYDFQAADVATAGLYWGWFVVYSGAEKDTFPADGRGLAIDVTPSEP